MDNATTTHQDVPETLADVEIADGTAEAESAELHLPSADGEVDIVRTTQKVRWLMQRC